MQTFFKCISGVDFKTNFCIFFRVMSGNSGAAVVQGIDTLTSALKSNIVPDQEYLLQGSILDNHVDVLKHRFEYLIARLPLHNLSIRLFF